MARQLQCGDMLVVTAVNHETGAVTLSTCDEVFGPSPPGTEYVRIEEDGGVKWLPREEYEGRRDGTWVTFDSMGNQKSGPPQ